MMCRQPVLDSTLVHFAVRVSIAGQHSIRPETPDDGLQASNAINRVFAMIPINDLVPGCRKMKIIEFS